MKKTQTILIIEDNELNREILAAILEDDYHVLTAENGLEGLNILNSYKKPISLILLDIQMPVMDGYGFLNAVREEGQYIDIPIIVTTATDAVEEEIRCLEMGATDFVAKPYNEEIIKKRVGSMIRLRETSAMLHKVEHDSLTGAYTKDFFMEYVAQQLKNNPDMEYDMVCLELESYRLLHGRYGVEMCNTFMKVMVSSLEMCLPEDVLIGRIDDSQIALLLKHVPYAFHRDFMERCISLSENSQFPNLVVNAGVYLNIDRSLPVEVICHNAVLPIEGIRYQYGQFIAEYDDAIRKKVDQQQFLSDNMNIALKERQFKIYYQPKHNLANEAPEGAEALVRWLHPEMGFMNPGAFISLFEQNGFIYELDKYILDAVCRDLKKWMEEGKHIVPVSVNVSQTDFDQPDLADIFEKIVDRYQIPHDYIHFEITESANAPDAMKKSSIVNSFKSKGFEIELDDFGAGYSSLSILGELPIDVMKVDMSLTRNMFQPKYKAILQGALFTASQLQIRVVVEGVETVEQLHALKELCSGQLQLFIQGYYYSKPLPADQFEAYMNP